MESFLCVLCASVVQMHCGGTLRAVKAATVLCFLVAIGLALVVEPGRGGDYHVGSTLICSDCHVMHYSEAHSLAGGPPSTVVPLGGGGPFPKLLRQDKSQLCLACHDGLTNVPDVLGDFSGTYLRAAGQLNKETDSPGTGHTIGSIAPASGAGTQWNGNATTGLLCSHCHATHGNAYYRNLSTNPGNATGVTITYMTGATYDGSSVVQQIANSPLSSHYSVQNILYRRATQTSGLSVWCQGCHDYTTSTTKHPSDKPIPMSSSDPSFQWDAPHASRVPVVSPSQVIPGLDNLVFCLSCHKAHGSTHVSAELWDDMTTPALEDGLLPLGMDNTCLQCHNPNPVP